MLGSKPTRRRALAIGVVALSLLASLTTDQPLESSSAKAETPTRSDGSKNADLPSSSPDRARAPSAPAPPAHARAVGKAVASLATWVKGRGGRLGAHVLDLEDGASWGGADEDLSLNPASNMKLVTAAVALSELGPEYAFSTGLYGTLKAGRVDRLVLRGHGDPSLEMNDLWQLARALHNLGVRSVGAVLVDQSRFDDQFVPPAFEQQPDEWASFRAPVSAVAIDRNDVTLHVRPASAGENAHAWFEPPGVVEVRGAIATRKAGSGQSVQLSLSPPGAAGATPEKPGSPAAETAGKLVAQLGGHVAQGMPRMRFAKRLDDPRHAPGRALAAALEALDVEVEGDVALGGAEVQRRLVFHRSPPLSKLIHALGKRSDNFYAEMLLKVLGAEAGKLPARSQDGAEVVLAWLKKVGARSETTRIENGSGLFDANRLSAHALTTVLAHAESDPRIAPEFLAQLSVAGVDGTLRSRLRGKPTRRRVRAKTGTLARVISLSGYVTRPGGRRPIAFSFLVNDIEGRARAIRNRIDGVVEVIAQASRAR